MRQLKVLGPTITKRTPGLDRYLAEIDKYPFVDPDEEVILAPRARSGDEAAIDKLLKGNLKFVVSVAKQYPCEGGLELMDLIMAGNQGLLKAISRFDETKGFKLISYAVWWIRQSILTVINEEGPLIRSSANSRALRRKIEDTRQELTYALGYAPSDEEILNFLNSDGNNDISPSSFKLALKVIHPSDISSFDTPLRGDEPDSALLGDMIHSNDLQPDTEIRIADTHTVTTQLLALLKSGDADILSLRYGLHPGSSPMGIDEIAEMFGVTREAMRLRIKNSLKKLKARARKMKSLMAE